jgi:hypothetical protein
MRADPLGMPGELRRTVDCRGYQARAAAHGLQRGDSIDQADKAEVLWSLPWETPSGGSLHSGAQTGVAPDGSVYKTFQCHYNR